MCARAITSAFRRHDLKSNVLFSDLAHNRFCVLINVILLTVPSLSVFPSDLFAFVSQ